MYLIEPSYFFIALLILLCIGFQFFIYRRIVPPMILYDQLGMTIRKGRDTGIKIKWAEINDINVEEKEKTFDGITDRYYQLEIQMNNRKEPEIFKFMWYPLETVSVLKEFLLFLRDNLS